MPTERATICQKLQLQNLKPRHQLTRQPLIRRLPLPLLNVNAYNFKAARMFHEGRVWFFTAQTWNTEPLDFHLRFMGTVPNADDAPTGVAYLCRGDEIPTQDITQPEFDFILSHDKAHKCPEFDPLTQCGPETVHSCLPAVSGRTRVKFISSEDETKYDYNEIIHKSILFYEAQRSGKLPAGNPIPWRGDSGLKDGCDVGHDLTGGWYDAGDNVKFGFPMAYSATVLAWGIIEFNEAYFDSGDLEAARESLKWVTDYFVKAHTSANELYVQVGNPSDDHGQWTRPEDIRKVRQSYKIDENNPGSEVAAETAAALAAASIVFRDVDQAYADDLILHARLLYKFADDFRGNYHNSVPSVRNFYKSWNGYNDELLWGAMWLYKATGEVSYLNTVENRYDQYGANSVPGEFSWDNKYAGVQILLAQSTQKSKYKNAVEAFVNSAKNIGTTPQGLTWKIQWGPNRYAANFAFISAMAAKLESESAKKSNYIAYSKKQINYLLGDNEIGKSYVIGHTSASPKRPHHRSSSCPAWSSLPAPGCSWNDYNMAGNNPHILYGALVGGPNKNGQYTDDRKDYISNEVAVDYNAGFQSTVAALQYFALNGAL
uniref:Endoglucanase n=1 Tax=Phallusia mammillata TaxID=59560 RepID=A0A6F9DJE6_9ASCI|nr:uncharacterized protein LOC100186903 [Phallusia mammillata]